MTEDNAFDVVVLGAGPAGLAAALTLLRARRRTLVLDSGQARNRFAPHSHGVLGFDGAPPSALLDAGRADVARYGGEVRDDPGASAEQDGDGFRIRTASGATVTALRLVVATGVRDELPPVPGLPEQWGRGVVVCPYCDGWESRDSRIGVLATGAKSLGQTHLVRQWSGDVVLLTNDALEVSEHDRDALRARGVEVRDGAVERIEQADGRLTGARVAGEPVPLDRIFTSPHPVPNDAVLRSLGAAMVERGGVETVEVDRTGATSVPGVWAAGNVAHPSEKVQTAAGDGMAVATFVNESLVAADVARAVRSAVRA